jgi:hypothetical protein
VVQSFVTKVKGLAGVLSQPDSATCQSTCVAMAIGTDQVFDIRSRLVQIGDPGNPYTMGTILHQKLGARYLFEEDASLTQMREWLQAGEFLITHGWFTGSGHVVGMDGVEIDPKTMSYRFNMRDPWDEFDAPSWSYLGRSNKFDGFYSSRCIYAACVAGQSRGDAAAIYRRGELDSARKGAWVHRVRP